METENSMADNSQRVHMFTIYDSDKAEFIHVLSRVLMEIVDNYYVADTYEHANKIGVDVVFNLRANDTTIDNVIRALTNQFSKRQPPRTNRK